MPVKMFFAFFLTILICQCVEMKKFVHTKPSPKFDNPNFVRDRYKGGPCVATNTISSLAESLNRSPLCPTIYMKTIRTGYCTVGSDVITKPEMPEPWKNKYRQPFNPAWMDYCDPYHCNDYHRIACGLNRDTMRFKWFQSVCHVIMNNQCSDYRGSLKYDVVDSKYCRVYVMYLRDNCPRTCIGEELQPVCGISSVDNHFAIFRNECALEAANCGNSTLQEYEKVDNGVCEQYLRYIISK